MRAIDIINFSGDDSLTVTVEVLRNLLITFLAVRAVDHVGSRADRLARVLGLAVQHLELEGDDAKQVLRVVEDALDEWRYIQQRYYVR